MKGYIYNKKKGILYNSFLFFKLNFVYNTSILVACIIIGSLTNNIHRAIITGIILYFWAYFIHVLAHNVPDYMNPHKYHHTPSINHTWWAMLIESIVNILGSGGASLIILNILIEKYFNVTILDNYTLLYTTFLYTSFHMINYHYLKVQTHKLHHDYEKYNFGPDIMDILFKTKVDKDEIENMNHATINSILILTFILLSFKTKYDIVDHLKSLII